MFLNHDIEISNNKEPIRFTLLHRRVKYYDVIHIHKPIALLSMYYCTLAYMYLHDNNICTYIYDEK